MTHVIWLGSFLVALVVWRRQTTLDLRPRLDALRLLVGYGSQRVPTILGMVLILSCPVLLAKHLGLPAADAVVIGGGMAILRMLGITNQLMTYVILPRIAWAQANRPEMLARVMWILLAFSFFVGATAAMGLLGTGDAVLRIWLNRDDLGSPGLTEALWLAALPFVMIYFLRPTIDGLDFRGYNSLNVLISIIFMAVAIGLSEFVFHSSNPVGHGVLAAGICLCVLSVVSVRRLTADMVMPKVNLLSPDLWLVIGLTAFLALTAFFLRDLVRAGTVHVFAAVPIMGAVCLVYFGASSAVLRRQWNSTFEEQRV